MFIQKRIKFSEHYGSLSIKENINVDFCVIYTRTLH